MDGMGGGDAGEVASKLIRNMLAKSMKGTADESPGERKYSVQQALHKAQTAIQGYAWARHYNSMGSTVVSILFNPWNPDQALVCHVGDSRLYCLRNGELFLITQDHTVGNEMLQRKQNIDNVSPQLLHVLTRVVGGGQQLHPQWTEIAVCPGDIYLLCSDGVWGMLDDATIEMVMSSSHDPKAITELIESEGIGLSVEPTPQAFAQALISLFEDPERYRQLQGQLRRSLLERNLWTHRARTVVEDLTGPERRN